jgi:hypothetical protein
MRGGKHREANHREANHRRGIRALLLRDGLKANFRERLQPMGCPPACVESYSRRQWFFGGMAAICIVDFVDSMIKGAGHLDLLGGKYVGIETASLVCSIVAMKTQNVHFHAAFAVTSTLYQGFYYVRLFAGYRG